MLDQVAGAAAGPSPTMEVLSGRSGSEFAALEVDGVPDLSARLYKTVVDAANAAASWLQDFAVFFTEAGVIVLGLLLVLAWWRARTGSARAMAAALLAPVAVVVAYGTSEVAKLLIEQDRPCRAVPGAAPLTDCPELGDWSFPSNHSTIAGATAMAAFVCLRGRIGGSAVFLGALVAASRVVVGVHYPHDVLVGFALGAVVVVAVLKFAPARTAPLVERLREQPTLRLLLGPGAAVPEPEHDSDDDPRAPRDNLPEEADEDVEPELEDSTTVLAATPPPDNGDVTRLLPRTPHWPSDDIDTGGRAARAHPPRPPRRY